MADAVQMQDELTCDECGRYGAFDFGEQKLCPDCYESCGSCCPEFGKAPPEQGGNEEQQKPTS